MIASQLVEGSHNISAAKGSADMLPQGTTRSRPPRNRSQAHPGVHPLSTLTHRTQGFQPLPPPLGDPPYHYDLATARRTIEAQAAESRRRDFHTAGGTSE